MDSTVKPIVYRHDIPRKVLSEMKSWRRVSIDTETDGLDFRIHKLRLISFSNGSSTHLVHHPDHESKNLIEFFDNEDNILIFHWAKFDLTFLKAYLTTTIRGDIHCTKILAKLVDQKHSSGLKTVLRNILGVKIKKDQQKSKWNIDILSKEQIEYAANDVIHLDQLFDALHDRIQYNLDMEKGMVYKMAISEIQTSVELELRGYWYLTKHRDVPVDRIAVDINWWRDHDCV